MQHHFPLFCLDLEGVLWPEMWHSIAETSGIEELKLTTQQIESYDELMQIRLKALSAAQLGLPQIQQQIGHLRPLAGAKEFLAKLGQLGQIVIVSDTFREFLAPVLRELGSLMVFCNALQVDERGCIERYIMRSKTGKRGLVAALAQQGYTVGAAGDSYNDVGMLCEAQWGAFLFAPAHIVQQFPQLPQMKSYLDLLDYWKRCLKNQGPVA